MATIRAPFNFVPLNDRPYIPSWAEGVSQDIPFEDGLSGTLTIKICAETPIFVSDGKKNKDDKSVIEFCHVIDGYGNKHYFIPGSSIKGALRNVMEIISFGKMTQVQNQSFGIRNLSKNADGEFYRAKVKVDNVHCGWLWMEGNEYWIDDCGFPKRISADRIDEFLHTDKLHRFITEGDFRKDENRTAKHKYELLDIKYDDQKLKGKFSKDTSCNINSGGREFVRYDKYGEPGTIVLTGQPGVRKQVYDKKKGKYVWTGKYFDFVFPQKDGSESIKVSDSVFKAFDTVHQDSPDYKEFRKLQLQNGEAIPVFFIYDDENNEVESMGISYMYKFPAFNSVYSGIPFGLLDNDNRDLCECIFGYTDNSNSLKGRVQFSAANLETSPSFDHDTDVVLSKPHPSYYPLYLGKGQTWNSESIELAGRKRYPTRDANNLLSNQGTKDMASTIRPIKPGAEFEGKIHFHNLRPIELGAIISTITFCDNPECYHGLGQGKPLGYGKVKISVVGQDIKKLSTGESYNKDSATEAFSNEMEKAFPGWKNRDQLKELFAMAKGIPANMMDRFTYMKMSTNQNQNEFKKARDDEYAEGYQLGYFTEIISNKVRQVGKQRNVSTSAKRIDVEKKLREKEEARQRMIEAFNAAVDNFNNNNFAKALMEFQELSTKSDHPHKEEVDFYLAEIEKKREESEACAQRAKVAYNNKNFDDAKKLYIEAEWYGFAKYYSEINSCEEAIAKENTLNSDMSSYLSDITIASISAFAGRLRKRHEKSPISSEDVPYIVEKLRNGVSALKKKDQKTWLDRSKWKQIEDVLGKNITDAIYNGLKDS